MKILNQTYWALTSLVVIDLALYLFEQISLPGNIPDWLLFWSWFVLTFVVIISQIKKKWAIVYGTILLILTIMSFVPMGVPILTVFAFAVDPVDTSVDLDSRIRLRATAGVMGPLIVEAVKNYYLFEKTVGTTDGYFNVEGKYYRLEDVESVKRLPDLSDSLAVSFKFKTGSVTRTF